MNIYIGVQTTRTKDVERLKTLHFSTDPMLTEGRHMHILNNRNINEILKMLL